MSADVLDLFLELAAISSPSYQERPVADAVLRYLRDLGLEVVEDDTAAKTGSSIGNLYCRIAPTTAGTPLFFCAHLDTVPPAGPLEPVVEDGVVRNAGGTILGADNKAAVAAMLDAVRRVLQQGLPHAGIELVFTPLEEVGLFGAKAFDVSRLEARDGYVYDVAGPIGGIVVGAPHHHFIDLRFHGRSAHSGIAPEEGRSALVAAGRALADFRLGRIDDETTANVGVVTGGSARNVIPDFCELKGEVRSHDERKVAELLEETLEVAAFAASASDCRLEAESTEAYRGYRFGKDDLPVRLADEALARCGFEPRHALTGGGADANVFNAAGLACVNLAHGVHEIHTPNEHVAVDDLERMVEVTLALLAAASAVEAGAESG